MYLTENWYILEILKVFKCRGRVGSSGFGHPAQTKLPGMTYNVGPGPRLGTKNAYLVNNQLYAHRLAHCFKEEPSVRAINGPVGVLDSSMTRHIICADTIAPQKLVKIARLGQ